ncbi:MAG: recombination protein RecR, recombination protein RecR [Candidatus Parcubacteria bacterium]|jgi:recombination protein RecR
MDNLSDLFKKFPGIGGRQAKRFVSFIMHASPSYRKELIAALNNTHANVRICVLCNKRYIQNGHNDNASICSTCKRDGRDSNTLLIVANDSDVDVFEKTISFNGQYYVLGRYIPLFAEHIEEYVNVGNLTSRVDALVAKGLQEIILATNATSDGDYTAKILREFIQKKYEGKIKVSTLGRGLSTGGELEYADQETLREAMQFRR